MSDRRRDREKPRERDRDRDRDRDQDRPRDHGRDREVDRHRGRDSERDRDREERDRRRDRDRKRSRSPSADRSHRRHSHSHRGRSSPSPDNAGSRHKRRRDGSPAATDHNDDKKPEAPLVPKSTGEGGVVAAGEGEMDMEEMDMMKMMGIPVGFDSTKGKHVPDADVSGVRVVTKRQPRQYMNRRGGFNRPLPPERNR